jgi:hypothetical protein
MAYKEAIVRSQPRLSPKNKPKNGWRPEALNGRSALVLVGRVC